MAQRGEEERDDLDTEYWAADHDLGWVTGAVQMAPAPRRQPSNIQTTDLGLYSRHCQAICRFGNYF